MKTCDKCQDGSKQNDDKLMDLYHRLGLELQRRDTGFRLVTAADVDTGRGSYDTYAGRGSYNTYDYDEGKIVSRKFSFRIVDGLIASATPVSAPSSAPVLKTSEAFDYAPPDPYAADLKVLRAAEQTITPIVTVVADSYAPPDSYAAGIAALRAKESRR